MSILNKLWLKTRLLFRKPNKKCKRCESRLECREAIDHFRIKKNLVCPGLRTEIPPFLHLMNDKAPPHMKQYLIKLHKAFAMELRLHRDYSMEVVVKDKVIEEYNRKYDIKMTQTMLMNLDIITLFSRLALKDLIESNYQVEWLNGTGQTIEHLLIASAEMLADYEFIKFPPFTRKDERDVMIGFKDYFENRESWWEKRPEGVSGCFVEAITANHLPKAMVFELNLNKMTLEEFENYLINVTFVVNTLEHELHALVVANAKENAMKAFECVKDFFQQNGIDMGLGEGGFPPGFIIPND